MKMFVYSYIFTCNMAKKAKLLGSMHSVLTICFIHVILFTDEATVSWSCSPAKQGHTVTVCVKVNHIRIYCYTTLFVHNII